MLVMQQQVGFEWLGQQLPRVAAWVCSAPCHSTTCHVNVCAGSGRWFAAGVLAAAAAAGGAPVLADAGQVCTLP
jgi:hypothetical protein